MRRTCCNEQGYKKVSQAFHFCESNLVSKKRKAQSVIPS